MPDTPSTDPASGSPVEPATKAEPPEVVVRYRYSDGILLEGDTYPHKDAIKKAQPRWRWFRSLRKWGVPRTRERVLSSYQVEEHARGLEKAGVPNVRVDYQEPRPEDVRDFGEVIEERNERALDRAERLEDRAERLEGQAAAEHRKRRAIGDAIPMGQPILVGHHSEARHRRDIERMKTAMGREVEAIDAAEHARGQAAAAKHSVAQQESPRFALRRLLELAKEARGLEVKITGETPSGWRGEIPRGPATGEWLARLQTAAEENRKKTEHYRRVLDEAGYMPSSSSVLRVGDRVLTDKHPGEVRKVLSQLVEIQFDRAVRYSYGKGFENVQRLAYDRVWVPKATIEARKAPASVPATSPASSPSLTPVPAAPAKPAVDVEAIAAKHGMSRDRVGDGYTLHAALVEAERLGEGSRMARYLQETTHRRPDDVQKALGRARGVVALERDTWPPPPLRGDTYGKQGFMGLLLSLEKDPVVAELLETARTWPSRMKGITGVDTEHWFPRMATRAQHIVVDHADGYLWKLARGEPPTPALAQAARDALVASARRRLDELREALDPVLYDPKSSPQEVYPRLCKIDTDAARKVLEQVFGVRFEDDAEAYQLCEGNTTLDAIAKRAAALDEQRAVESAAAKAVRQADARALIQVYDDAFEHDTVTRRRFNLAYWRRHPELRAWQRPRHALTVTSKPFAVEATVRGPKESWFYVALPAGTEEQAAVDALLRELEKEGDKRARTSRIHVGGGRRARRMVPFLDAKPSRSADTKQVEEEDAMDEPESDAEPNPTDAELSPEPRARDEAAPGSLWTVEEEGFALLGQHGDGTRVHVPTGHQPALFDVGKPDPAVLERLRAEELAERRAKRPPSDTSDPLLGRADARLDPAEERLESAANGPPAEPVAAARRQGLHGSRTGDRVGVGISQRQVRSILSNRIHDDGPHGVSEFSTKHEPRLVRAAKLMAERGEVKLVSAPRGYVRITAGPKWGAEPDAPRKPKAARTRRGRKGSTPKTAPKPTHLLVDPRTGAAFRYATAAEVEAAGEGFIEVKVDGRMLRAFTDEIAKADWDGRFYVPPIEWSGGFLGNAELERWSSEPIGPEPVASKPVASKPIARLEYVDLATGVPADPSEPGTLSTGRIVADIDGETVEIDEEDLIGHGTDPDPRKRRYAYDAESPADYAGQARAKKATRAATQAARKKGKATRAGLRDTFDSPATAAASFYEHNEDFFDHVIDPWDGLRDWMDGVEVRVGRGHRKLSKTPAGRKILAEKHAARAIRGALAYLMGQAKGRRWDAVPWVQVERLGEALGRYFEAPSSGSSHAAIYWRPFAGELRAEDLDAMTPEQRASIREQESAREIGEQLEALQKAYDRAKDCLPDDLRRVIERRIGEWSRWVEDPSKIPGYACEPDPKTAGYLCNYPSVAGELAQLRRSCDDAYDPNWAAKESKEGAPGFPDTSQGEDDAPLPRTASAKACCSTETPKPEVCDAPACQLAAAGGASGDAGEKTDPEPAGRQRKKAHAPKASSAKRSAPTTPAATKGTAPTTTKAKPTRKLTVAERKQALAERKKDVERRRKLTAAQRRAQRLTCSASVAQHQVEAIDTVSYRRRVEDAAAAIKKAEEHVKEHERELKAAMREAEATMRKRDALPMDRELARRKVRDARCQLRVAQGALRQRRRDHQRAQTELQRALSRVGKREAIASKRLDEANRAKADASALQPDRR